MLILIIIYYTPLIERDVSCVICVLHIVYGRSCKYPCCGKLTLQSPDTDLQISLRHFRPNRDTSHEIWKRRILRCKLQLKNIYIIEVAYSTIPLLRQTNSPDTDLQIDPKTKSLHHFHTDWDTTHEIWKRCTPSLQITVVEYLYGGTMLDLSLIHISEPTRRRGIS